MNVPIEIILFVGGVILAICGHIFNTHDARIKKNTEALGEAAVDITALSSKIDESHRIRSSDIDMLHQLANKIERLMEKIHQLSLQLQNKQDRT